MIFFLFIPASPLAAGLVETHPPTEDEPAASLPDLDPIPSLPNLDLDNGLEVMNRTVSEPDLSTEDQAELLINRAGKCPGQVWTQFLSG